MPSRAESIAARIAALLTGTTDAGSTVYRDRADALARTESPAILVELSTEDTTPLGGGRAGFAGELDQDELLLAVIFCVRSAAWQTVADAVRVQAHALIMADATLKALVASVRRDSAAWRAASADLPFGHCAQVYRFKSLTRAHALDQSP